MDKLLNGFNNGRDKSDGIGGKKPIFIVPRENDETSASGLNLACVINWVAADKLPDYDGAYLCYVKAKQECGNVWEYQKVVQNEYNKWVLDCGEAVVAWAELPKPPCL